MHDRILEANVANDFKNLLALQFCMQNQSPINGYLLDSIE